MEDAKIIELYWQRSEEAIGESDRKYGAYCRTVAGNILADVRDREECVNDTWLRAWNAMPPQRPRRLSAFFGKIARRLAIDRFRERTAEKRGGGAVPQAIEELEECVASPSGTEAEFSRRELERDLSDFLRGLPRRDREVFLGRYFSLCSTAELARKFGLRENNVLLILSRTRKKLRVFLEKEGYVL